MTQPSSPATRTLRHSYNFESWMMGDPELDEHDLLVLAAYQQAVKSSSASATIEQSTTDATELAHDEKPAVRIQPTVLRLAEIDGIESERLSGIHGKLIAVGYLTAEVVGRSDGIVYRLTREGQRRLSGESVEEAA